MKQLDLREKVTATTTYEQFMTLRNLLVDPLLRMFMDKIEFKKFLKRIKVAYTPTLFMSNDPPPWNLAQYVEDRKDYVVKPVHFSYGGYAFVVKDGRTQWWGISIPFDPHNPDSLSEADAKKRSAPYYFDNIAAASSRRLIDVIEEEMGEAFNRSCLQLDSSALKNAVPGIFVEEMVVAEYENVPRVLEIQCHVIWGEALLCEYMFTSIGSIVFMRDPMWGVAFVNPPRSADGQPESFGFYPVSDLEIQDCLLKVIPITERVARAANADHLRVDVLARGACEDLFVSECDICPGVMFPFEVRQLLRDRWLYGYGVQTKSVLYFNNISNRYISSD
jgi:hypothetical protein